MRNRNLPVLLALLGIVVGLAVVRRTQRAAPAVPWTPAVWTPVEMRLPPSIKVYSSASQGPGAPLRCWHIDVDYSDDHLHAVPYLSTSPTGREPASVMATKLGALVAINGGYFDMQGVPARTFSLVRHGGKTLVPNIAIVKRMFPAREYSVTRSAFGIRADRSFDVAWVAQQGDALWSYPRPVPHTMTTVAPPPTRNFPPGGRAWDAVDAIGAGPTLISDGQLQDTYENEVFFGSGFPNDELYPRAAIGYTRDHHMILFATDGDQIPFGGGLTLAQLAQEMQHLNCIEAMNLDGGGSETLVVNGHAINHPSDPPERAVTSILAIIPNAAGPAAAPNLQ